MNPTYFRRSGGQESASVYLNSANASCRPPGFRFSGCVYSDIGLIRPNNEDNYVLDGYINVSPENVPRHKAAFSVNTPGTAWHIAGVFDGIGGGEKGELASRVAADIFSQACLDLKFPASKEKVDMVLRRCFQEANNRIVELKKEYRIYGTTGTVLCTSGSEWKLYHLGDSRGYLFRDGELFQLTRDQTLAQMKIDMGIYDVCAPGAKAEYHTLTEFIGRDQTLKNLRPVESQWIPVLANDRVLLCSDGLYDMCDDQQIACILANAVSAAEAARALTDAAIDGGGIDNITCLVMAFI